MRKIIAIIPARSGSKGIKDKNIKELNGKPLIAYTIEAALESNVFEDVIVSTDSEEYADISRRYGATVPFLRPKKLAEDISKTNDVIQDVILKLKAHGKEYDDFMLLQPTSPLRTKDDIIESVKIYKEKKVNALISVCKCEHSPLTTMKLNKELSLDGFLLNLSNNRRQDLAQYYRVNGAIYLMKVEYFLKYRYFYKEKSYAYIMNKRKSIDIDDIYDFEYAEFLIKKYCEL